MRAAWFSKWIVLLTLTATVDIFGQNSLTNTNKTDGNAPTTCLETTYYSDVETPTLKPIDEPGDSKSTSISGTLSKAQSGQIQLCADDGSSVGSTEIKNTDSFTVSAVSNLKAGQKIQAQFIDGNGHPGVPSEPELVGDCSKLASKSGTAPILTIAGGTASSVTYSGTVKGAKGGSVRICVNDVPKATVTVDQNGKFNGGTATLQVKAGDDIAAELVNFGASPSYGPVSQKVKIVVQPAAAENQNNAVAVLIGGVEYSGYSAQSQTTNGFLSLFYQGPFYHGVSGWERSDLPARRNRQRMGLLVLSRTRLDSQRMIIRMSVRRSTSWAVPSGSFLTSGA